jgi:hypothetical protein
MNGSRRLMGILVTATVLLSLPGRAHAWQAAPAPAASPAAAAGTTPTAPAAPAVPSAKAAAIADEVMKALGGQEAWNATRYLRFDFGSERDGVLQVRSHTWDKHTGRYRLEGKNREGKPFVTLMDLNSRQGSAWLEGNKLSGEDEKKQLEQAYGAWVNDTYWLLMPYKLKDPGVILSDAGEKTEAGVTYDVIGLSFEGVGLTPKDRYWVYVNRNTRLVDRWDFVLKGEDKPPTTFTWQGWTKKGAIMLAGERVNAKDNRRLLFPVLETPASIPDSVFTTP